MGNEAELCTHWGESVEKTVKRLPTVPKKRTPPDRNPGAFLGTRARRKT